MCRPVTHHPPSGESGLVTDEGGVVRVSAPQHRVGAHVTVTLPRGKVPVRDCKVLIARQSLQGTDTFYWMILVDIRIRSFYFERPHFRANSSSDCHCNCDLLDIFSPYLPLLSAIICHSSNHFLMFWPTTCVFFPDCVLRRTACGIKNSLSVCDTNTLYFF